MKITKTGKISIKLPPILREPLILAAQQRLYYENEDLEHYSFFLLHETLQRLQRVSTNRIQFRFSEFFILLTPQTMQYLDEPTQILIRDAIEERSKGTRLDIAQMDDPDHVRALREHFLRPPA
ncbi:hypothetical protein [Flavilitoribacter nigricans]|uniref:Uncharacterized protein n=1 Tax=Flavilitoribacter nigricans (strain ATCC 23147 / DSM 23189 / NBRC 102662 / NCIMB 1420 / SS-2) TaxID=1122177 RepID=A0A2D0NJ96_FLAN2|nr:hypothetical protein [Flavilitoribacter nigricans]PHN07823.1 hypothetical protein CRP01_04690 [Flavilitoribacter nigricans DSM 23189 = NBRC 102662]